VYDIWSTPFRKTFFSYPEQFLYMVYKKTEFALGKKKISYLEQYLCIVYDILSIAFRKKKILLSISLHNIV